MYHSEFSKRPIGQLRGRHRKRPFVCPDLKPLHINQISTLTHYVADKCKEMNDTKGKEGKGEKVDRLELVKRLINPVAFKMYFELTKKQEQVANRMTWNAAYCPGEA